MSAKSDFPHHCGETEKELTSLRAQLAEAVAREAVLREALVFSAETYSFNGRTCCRFCDSYKGEPHVSDCRAGRALSSTSDSARALLEAFEAMEGALTDLVTIAQEGSEFTDPGNPDPFAVLKMSEAALALAAKARPK